jgi:hypothetical protein
MHVSLPPRAMIVHFAACDHQEKPLHCIKQNGHPSPKVRVLRWKEYTPTLYTAIFISFHGVFTRSRRVAGFEGEEAQPVSSAKRESHNAGDHKGTLGCFLAGRLRREWSGIGVYWCGRPLFVYSSLQYFASGDTWFSARICRTVV